MIQRNCAHGSRDDLVVGRVLRHRVDVREYVPTTVFNKRFHHHIVIGITCDELGLYFVLLSEVFQDIKDGLTDFDDRRFLGDEVIVLLI